MRAPTLSIALAAMFVAAGCGDDAKGSMNNPAPVCGDGHVDSGEECDDGNSTNGDGCETSCKFTCSSTDATRGCGEAPDDCHAAGVCNETTHMCIPPGAAVADGHACNNGTQVCMSGVCTDKLPTARCGDGHVDSSEECDDGNSADGDGCNADCTFSCKSTDATRDCSGGVIDECHVESTCNDTTHACQANNAANGTTCDGGDKVCMAGVCTTPSSTAVCGDGHVDTGEECDDGNSVDGDGCDTSCKFSCVSTDSTRDCATSTDECHVPTACNDTSHTCVGGGSVPDFQTCDGGQKSCVGGVCVAPACGNGVREFGEQCDDGNALSLDGCDNNCQFEESQRIISLVQQFVTDDPFCPGNALGAAITEGAQPVIQFTWDGPVAVGDISLVFKFLGLQSLTGGDTPFTLGFVKARAGGRTLAHATVGSLGEPLTPVCGNGICEESDSPGLVPSEGALGCPDDCAYDGTNDLDWWYVRDPGSVDASETPKETLTGQILNHRLTAGPGNITVNLEFAFQPTSVSLFNTVVDAAVDGPVNKPTVASSSGPPGHLASEHLDPNLVTVSGSTTGRFCSQVSSLSLANTPASSLLRSQCTQANPDDPSKPLPVYNEDNSVLDIFLSGCVSAGSENSPAVIIATQPDGGLDQASYHFTVDTSTHKVNGCTRDGAPADLQSCLAQATFSSYFFFASDRVIIKRN